MTRANPRSSLASTRLFFLKLIIHHQKVLRRRRYAKQRRRKSGKSKSNLHQTKTKKCFCTFVALNGGGDGGSGGHIFDDIEPRKLSRRHLAPFNKVRIPPRRSALDLFLLEKPEDGSAVHVGWYGQAGNLQKCRRQVHVAHQALHHPAAAHSRTPHQKGHAHIRLERERLA